MGFGLAPAQAPTPALVPRPVLRLSQIAPRRSPAVREQGLAPAPAGVWGGGCRGPGPQGGTVEARSLPLPIRFFQGSDSSWLPSGPSTETQGLGGRREGGQIPRGHGTGGGRGAWGGPGQQTASSRRRSALPTAQPAPVWPWSRGPGNSPTVSVSPTRRAGPAQGAQPSLGPC